MKSYTRGTFRAIKNPFGFGYLVQARRRRTPEDSEYWVDLAQFDYLANARVRVRNLHFACSTMDDLHLNLKKKMKTPKQQVLERHPSAICVSGCGAWFVFLDDDKNVTLGEGRSASSAWYNAAYLGEAEQLHAPGGEVEWVDNGEPIQLAREPEMVEFCGGNGKHTGTYDMVNSPPHYQGDGIECIDAIKAALTPEEFRGYVKGNAMKYVWRERNKGGDQDLEKAAWYLNRLKEEKP